MEDRGRREHAPRHRGVHPLPSGIGGGGGAGICGGGGRMGCGTGVLEIETTRPSSQSALDPNKDMPVFLCCFPPEHLLPRLSWIQKRRFGAFQRKDNPLVMSILLKDPAIVETLCVCVCVCSDGDACSVLGWGFTSEPIAIPLSLRTLRAPHSSGQVHTIAFVQPPEARAARASRPVSAVPVVLCCSSPTPAFIFEATASASVSQDASPLHLHFVCQVCVPCASQTTKVRISRAHTDAPVAGWVTAHPDRPTEVNTIC